MQGGELLHSKCNASREQQLQGITGITLLLLQFRMSNIRSILFDKHVFPSSKELVNVLGHLIISICNHSSSPCRRNNTTKLPIAHNAPMPAVPCLSPAPGCITTSRTQVVGSSHPLYSRCCVNPVILLNIRIDDRVLGFVARRSATFRHTRYTDGLG